MEDVAHGWPADLVTIFAALGKTMGQRQLRPELLAELPLGRGAIVEGHVVEITHKSGRELGQKRGRYTIEMQGARWLDGGRWSFLSGDLEKLARSAMATVS